MHNTLLSQISGAHLTTVLLLNSCSFKYIIAGVSRNWFENFRSQRSLLSNNGTGGLHELFSRENLLSHRNGSISRLLVNHTPIENTVGGNLESKTKNRSVVETEFVARSSADFDVDAEISEAAEKFTTVSWPYFFVSFFAEDKNFLNSYSSAQLLNRLITFGVKLRIRNVKLSMTRLITLVPDVRQKCEWLTSLTERFSWQFKITEESGRNLRFAPNWRRSDNQLCSCRPSTAMAYLHPLHLQSTLLKTAVVYCN